MQINPFLRPKEFTFWHCILPNLLREWQRYLKTSYLPVPFNPDNIEGPVITHPHLRQLNVLKTAVDHPEDFPQISETTLYKMTHGTKNLLEQMIKDMDQKIIELEKECA